MFNNFRVILIFPIQQIIYTKPVLQSFHSIRLEMANQLQRMDTCNIVMDPTGLAVLYWSNADTALIQRSCRINVSNDIPISACQDPSGWTLFDDHCCAMTLRITSLLVGFSLQHTRKIFGYTEWLPLCLSASI